MKELVKIVVYVPAESASTVIQTIGDCGGGVIGKYSYCSFSAIGTGRYVPHKGANPKIGKIGSPEEVSEQRTEVTCDKSDAKAIVSAIKNVHPYEEPTIDIYPLLSPEML